jgi:hypothetical protein
MHEIDRKSGVDIMSNASQDKRLLSERALRQLISVALDKNYFRERWHAEHEHPERNISTDDVIHGLERKDWTLAESPNLDEEHHNYEYLIRTADIEGDELHIKVAAFPSLARFEVITRW